MGDSTCLMQPFCYASGLTNEANESNQIHALAQSISFGRFMSESLAWEKWSSFSHNRYVEEAERYSKPGSVAQKKAFFEAHYKKLAAQKAAALLEQAKNAAPPNNATGQQDGGEVVDSTHNSQTTSPNSKMVVKEEQDAKVLTLTSEEPDAMLSATVHDSNSNIKASNIPESNNVEGAEQEMEQQALIGNSMKVELESQLEDVDTHKEQSEKLSGTRTPPIMKQDSNSDQEVLASMGKKKPPVSSFKLLMATGTSKFTSTPVKSTDPISSKRDNIATPVSSFKLLKATGTSKFTSTSTPVKSTAPISSKRDNIATPMSIKPSADKKRSTPKSLQMSVNFTPIRELNRLTASVIRKFESTRVGAGSSKASKDSSTPLRTPTMASKNEMQKHSSLTPLTEKKRNKTPIDSSASGNHTAGPKWRLLSAEHKIRSPIISSPFSLRTEERAARRKKKLEEKFNANEGQKVQLHTKLKEKAETEIRKLRQSFCFKARPLPDFYKERKASKDETKKDPLTHSESLKEGRKTTPRTSVVESKTPLPPNRPSLKNNVTKNFQGKSGGTSIHPLASYSRMITIHENASPNIHHGNQNDRNYK